MANPVLIVKAAAMALSNEKIRKGVGWIVVAILSPILVLVAILCGMLSEAAYHNNSALDLCFHGGTFADDVPECNLRQPTAADALLSGQSAQINGCRFSRLSAC